MSVATLPVGEKWLVGHNGVQMFKSPNSNQTSDRDRELRPLTNNELELVSGGAINPDPDYDRMMTKVAAAAANVRYAHP
jgi:hypothetical protein